MKFLSSHKVKHNKFEVNCLLVALNSNCEEKIGFDDFLKMILPREKKATICQDSEGA